MKSIRRILGWYLLSLPLVLSGVVVYSVFVLDMPLIVDGGPDGPAKLVYQAALWIGYASVDYAYFLLPLPLIVLLEYNEWFFPRSPD